VKPHHLHPLSHAWLRGLVVQVMAGEISHFKAQQLAAYYVYQRRWLAESPGDRLSDWLDAAHLLNHAASNADLDVTW
jgi:hypothetical protein